MDLPTCRALLSQDIRTQSYQGFSAKVCQFRQTLGKLFHPPDIQSGFFIWPINFTNSVNIEPSQAQYIDQCLRSKSRLDFLKASASLIRNRFAILTSLNKIKRQSDVL